MTKLNRAFRPAVDQLEDRLVLANSSSLMGVLQAAFSASFSAQSTTIVSSTTSSNSNSTTTTSTSAITATLVNGVLTITGADSADNIVVRTRQNTIEVQGTGQTFTATDVVEVVIRAGGGNDLIDLRGLSFTGAQGPNARCTIFGNAGKDTIFGSAWADVIHGGAGNDNLCGNGGNDQIFGDNGNDRLEGRTGDDLLDGGKGRDILLGGAGADILCSAIDSFVDRLDGGAGSDTFRPNQIAGLLSRDLTDVLRSLEIHLTTIVISLPPSVAVSVDTIRADLAGRLEVPLESIHVVKVEQVTWPDTALGCPQPGMMYAQVLVAGRRIILEAGGTTYEYHTDDAFKGRFILCTNP